MTMTVDVVIAGATCAAFSAAIDAASQDKRVLVVAGARGTDLRRRVRRARRIAGARSKQICVLTGAEIECVGGLRSVEAVLIRYTGTGRRVDVNTSALLMFEETETNDRNSRGGSNVCRVY